MTDRLKTVYQHKTPFCGGYRLVFSIARTINSEGTNSCFSCSVNSVSLTLDERFVRFSCVAPPFYPEQVRYSYGDIS